MFKFLRRIADLEIKVKQLDDNQAPYYPHGVPRFADARTSYGRIDNLEKKMDLILEKLNCKVENVPAVPSTKKLVCKSKKK